MKRGTIVQNNLTGEYSIFLSEVDDQSRVAVVEDIYDEFDAIFIPKVTSIKTVPSIEIREAIKYPNYFNQISIS